MIQLADADVDLAGRRFTLAPMLPLCISARFNGQLRAVLCSAVGLSFVLASRGASLETFATLFTQITNDISTIESSFDNSSAQKQTLASLVKARAAILSPEQRDEQALATLVNLLGDQGEYSAALDRAAADARDVVMSGYDALALRVEDLPPSIRTTRARNRFALLAPDAASLAGAQHAGGIAALLAPLGRQLEAVSETVARAATMPVPATRQNSVHAQVNGQRFVSSSAGRHSPDEFQTSAPTSLYWETFCRVIDGSRVIAFSLPVVTSQVRYEIAQGLASLTYTENVFAPGAVALEATSGTFFVQSDRDEIYGLFSAAGPGFEVKNGKFRIELPRELRSH